MRNGIPIFYRSSINKTAHTIRLTFIFVCTLALRVVLNSPVKTFSFPDGQFFTNQSVINIDWRHSIRAWIVSNEPKLETYRVDQLIKFFSSVSSNSQIMSEKKSYKKCDNRECRTCNDAYEEIYHAFTNLLLVIGALISCVIVTKFYYKYFLMPTINIPGWYLPNFCVILHQSPKYKKRK
jgi:hypothetical protein